MDNSEAIFKAMQGRFKQAWGGLPVLVANEMVNFTKERFAAQSWLGSRVEPWQKRKAKKDNNGRAILVKSGRLKRSPRPITKGDMAGVGIDVPYAQIHNDGFKGMVQVKAHTRKRSKAQRIATIKTIKPLSGINAGKAIGQTQVKAHGMRMNMPRRRFVGPSEFMMRRLKRVAGAYLLKSLK